MKKKKKIDFMYVFWIFVKWHNIVLEVWYEIKEKYFKMGQIIM
jgi:hypothetical protein